VVAERLAGLDADYERWKDVWRRKAGGGLGRINHERQRLLERREELRTLLTEIK